MLPPDTQVPQGFTTTQPNPPTYPPQIHKGLMAGLNGGNPIILIIKPANFRGTGWMLALPETKSKFAPENGCLEYDSFFSRPIFRQGPTVSFRGCCHRVGVVD